MGSQARSLGRGGAMEASANRFCFVDVVTVKLK